MSAFLSVENNSLSISSNKLCSFAIILSDSSICLIDCSRAPLSLYLSLISDTSALMDSYEPDFLTRSESLCASLFAVAISRLIRSMSSSILGISDAMNAVFLSAIWLWKSSSSLKLF